MNKYRNLSINIFLDISSQTLCYQKYWSVLQPFFLANETDWQTFNVTEVSGRNITLKTIVHFKNQTEIVDELHGDIANNTNLVFVLIASNLNIRESFLIDGPPIMFEKVYNCIGVA